MKTRNRLFVAILVIFLIYAFFPFSIFASNAGYQIIFSVSGEHTLALSMNGNTARIGEIVIDGQYVNIQNENGDSIGEVSVSNDGKEAVILVSSGEESFITYNSSGKFSLFFNGTIHQMNKKFSYSDGDNEGNVRIAIQDYSDSSHQNDDEQNGEEPSNYGNMSAIINIRRGEGTYAFTYENENGEKKTEEREYEAWADVGINGNIGRIIENNEDQTIISEVNYNLEEGEETVTFLFSTLWHLRFYEDIVINGKTYSVSDYLNYDNRDEWLSAYSGQVVSFEIPGIEIADTYDVVVKTGDNSRNVFIANFLWTGDPNQEFEKDMDGNYILDKDGNKIPGRDYIGNAHLEMVGLSYEVAGKTYTYTENDFKDGSFWKDYVEYDSNTSLGYDEGSLVIPNDSWITMRITPKYGYQVIESNFGELITTDTGVCEFKFKIGSGAAYFTANVVKTEDDVDNQSRKVTDGNIKVSNPEITTGTYRLSVNDVQLSQDKITNFEKAAGNYTISEYLDIDLNQVFYRGNSESVWENKIDELKDYATITLKLEDGVNVKDIVIVHNIHDGEDFEIIEIDSYDEETNTITFKTKSFSNYAIASKNETKIEDVKYSFEDDTYIIEFNDIEGQNFKFSVQELLNLNDEQIERLGASKEVYISIIEKIKNNLKKYSEVLNLYEINLFDINKSSDKTKGTFNFKIKLTDNMKKFDTFKLINIDDSDFSVKDIVELKQDGDYLIGDLPHLSLYALVADKSVENTKTDTETSNTSVKTGDTSYIYIAVLLGAVVILFTMIVIRKKLESK